MSSNSGGESDNYRFRLPWSEYDILLALLPLPLTVGGVLGHLFPMPYHLGLGFGGMLSTAILGYAVFVATPVES